MNRSISGHYTGLTDLKGSLGFLTLITTLESHFSVQRGFFPDFGFQVEGKPHRASLLWWCLYAQKVTTNAFNRAQKESLIDACNIWELAFQGLENELQKQKASKGKGKQKASVQNANF